MQVPTKPKEAKKLIPAAYPPDAVNPKNVTDEQNKRWLDDMRTKREQRDALVAQRTQIPVKPTAVLTIKLEKYGRYWMAKAVTKGKTINLTVSPTDIQSALGSVDANVGRLALDL